MTDKKTVCDRCGRDVKERLEGWNQLYHFKFKDCLGEDVEMDVCWDCDWDITNGGDPFEEIGDICMRRWENDYEYDPINTPPPY